MRSQLRKKIQKDLSYMIGFTVFKVGYLFGLFLTKRVPVKVSQITIAGRAELPETIAYFTIELLTHICSECALVGHLS